MNNIKYTTEWFIKKCREVHGNFYSYEKTNYINAKTKVVIVCPIHGIFEQQPTKHLSGHGCLHCSKIKIHIKMTKSLDKFIEEAYKKYNNFYSYEKSNYINAATNIIIICPIHGEFEQSPHHHLYGKYGCKKCYALYKTKSKEAFIEKAIKVHGNRYDYSEMVYVRQKIPAMIICKIHGKFMQRPDNHLHGQGCPMCRTSKGERKISKYLDNNHIQFKNQVIFNECLDKRVLPFDFGIYDEEQHIIGVIEYQGQQHYRETEIFGGKKDFEIRRKHDLIKKQFCIDNKINFLEIKYNEESKMIQLLDNFIGVINRNRMEHYD